MKKSYIIGIVVAVIVVIGISLGSGYNKMVKENENVESVLILLAFIQADILVRFLISIHCADGYR